jgi:hypothetical protein
MATRFSPRFAILLLLLHTMAATLVHATDMPTQFRLAMLLFILLSLVYYQARDVFRVLPYSWSEFSVDQGSVAVVTRDGTKLLGRLANESIVSPYFILLHIRQEGRYLPVSRVIFPDALQAGTFRELCVRLKFS